MRVLILNLKNCVSSTKFTVSDTEAERVLTKFHQSGGRPFMNEGMILKIDGCEGQGAFALCDIAGVHSDFAESPEYFTRGFKIIQEEA